MAIRYAGIEFDTVEELVRYKQLMEGKIEKKVVVVHEQAKPIDHKYFGKIQKGKRGRRNHKASDEKVVELIKSMKRKLCLTKIWQKLGYKGGMKACQKQRLERVIAENNLQDRIKQRANRIISPVGKTAPVMVGNRQKGQWLSSSDKEQIRQMRLQGKAIIDIARLYNKSDVTIYQTIKGNQKPALTTETIIKERESGKSFGQIGKQLGMSKNAVFYRYMRHRKPLVPTSYVESAKKLAERQTTCYSPFPELVMNNGMLRLTTQDLIRHNIDGINAEYAEHFGITNEKEWLDFLIDFMQKSGEIARHFGFPNKFKLEQNKITYKG